MLSTIKNQLLPEGVVTPDEVTKQELGLQLAMELQWRQLVETMAPNCTDLNVVFGQLKALIDGAIG